MESEALLPYHEGVRITLSIHFAFVGVVCALACVTDDTTLRNEAKPAVQDAGKVDSPDVVTGSDAGTADGSAVLCGYAGEPCCKAPFLTCGEGTTCLSGSCIISSLRAVGFQRANLPDAETTGVSLFFDGNEWVFDPEIRITSQRENFPMAVWAASGEYRVITNNASDGKGSLWNFGTNGWLLCDNAGCGTTNPPQIFRSSFGFSATDFWISGAAGMYACSGAGECTKRSGGALPSSLGPGNLSGTSSSDLWLGQDSAAYHFNGTTWEAYTGTPSRAIWARTANDVWAGDSSIRHFDGTSWSTPYVLPGVTAGKAITITAISGSAPDNVWLAGYQNDPVTALTQRWDGTQWRNVPLPEPSDVQLQTLWAPSSSEVFAAGFKGDTIYKWNGTSWTTASLPRKSIPTRFTSIAGLARPRPQR
jgi:hypothetical protein